MPKIADCKKLLGVKNSADLAELKSVYRNFMKANHPDKFQDESEIQEAEARSKDFIEAYHFLVSIAPETRAKNLPEYKETITNAQLVYFEYKKQVLTADFSDGKSFEYFDVPKDIYNKLINADSRTRFARRRICNVFAYRSVNQAVTA